jgi:hypothetical protein
MTSNQSHWLSISIFSIRSQWHILLKSLEQPLEFFSKEGIILSFKIQFNYNQGDNVRLAILAPNSELEYIAKYINQWFTNYSIYDIPIVRNIDASHESIFMPYPSNSIRFGIYSANKLPMSNPFLALQQAVSTAVLNAFDNVPLERDMIVTVGFYLLLSCFKVIQEFEGLPAYWISCYENITIDKFTTEEVNKMVTKFKQLYHTIASISSDIENNLDTTNLFWIAKWQNSVVRAVKSAENTSQKKQLFNRINRMVEKQLALSRRENKLLSYLIYSTIRAAI